MAKRNKRKVVKVFCCIFRGSGVEITINKRISKKQRAEVQHGLVERFGLGVWFDGLGCKNRRFSIFLIKCGIFFPFLKIFIILSLCKSTL
jgi:hypothetical protein